ncbi:MAG: sigma-70 family RNA polymerase sigma factor [Planctomycetes bacterium]|nr:sigma-70 family RNA polymerase sigma factor [Planctomycetota bacterium]
MIDDTIAGPESHITDQTSVSLLERVRNRDDVAWQRLVDLYSPLVFSLCRRSGLKSEDASDIMQEVFAAIARKIGDFRRDRPGDTFRGWVRIITRNEIRMLFRRIKDQAHAVGGTSANVRLQEIAEDPLVESETADNEERSGLYHRALELIRNEFEEQTWKAAIETIVSGRSSVDVAADLGMTPGAVRQAKYKVLRKLRQELGEVLD